MINVVKRVWLPFIVVLVAVVGGFVVHRVRGYFGDHGEANASAPFQDTEPFNPKIVVYSIFSPDGSFADINYLDLDAQPQRLDGAHLPWTLTLETTNPSVFPNIVAQGDGSTIGCRITVDDVVRDERVISGVSAQTFCLVKSA